MTMRDAWCVMLFTFNFFWFPQEIPITDLPTEIVIPGLKPNTTYTVSLIPKDGNTTGPPTNKSATTGMSDIFRK